MGVLILLYVNVNTSTTKVRVDLRLTIAQKDKYLLERIQQNFLILHKLTL